MGSPGGGWSQPSVTAARCPVGWERGSGLAPALPLPHCSLPAAARHLLLTQHRLKAGILSSLQPQSCAQEAARELAREMVPCLSVRLSMHKLRGWSEADGFPVLLRPFRMVKLEEAGRALSPARGHPGGCAGGWQCPGCRTMRLLSCFIFQADAWFGLV